MRLVLEVQFDHELTERAQGDVKQEIQEFKEAMAFLSGKVIKAELRSGDETA